jgi:DNA adenine methylase
MDEQQQTEQAMTQSPPLTGGRQPFEDPAALTDRRDDPGASVPACPAPGAADRQEGPGADAHPPGKLTPPLKWHGGKRYLARRVLEVMPPHLHYVEPYFGGGQVLFARDRADRRLWWPHRTSDGREVDGVSELVNDLDGDLMNFYAVLKDPKAFARLRHRLELTLFSEAEWQRAGALLASGEGGALDRAAALFVCVRQSRQALRKDFATPVRTRLRGGRQDHVNAWWGAIEGLEAVHRRLKDVMVLCRPALQVIRQEDAPSTLHYLDPPYYHPTRTARKAYGRFEMTEADHRELLDVIRQCRGKVMLSGYASALYDEALAGWTRHTVDVPNNASGGRQKDRETEVLWCNY